MCVDWINDRDSQYTTQDIVQATQDYFKSIGVDTIEYTNDVEDRGSTSYLLMNANQVKSADPVTYDNNGKVIPLSERFKADNSDIRYSDRDPREVTESDVRNILDNIESYDKDSYFPVRINTPRALIEAARKRGDIIKICLLLCK